MLAGGLNTNFGSRCSPPQSGEAFKMQHETDWGAFIDNIVWRAWAKCLNLSMYSSMLSALHPGSILGVIGWGGAPPCPSILPFLYWIPVLPPYLVQVSHDSKVSLPVLRWGLYMLHLLLLKQWLKCCTHMADYCVMGPHQTNEIPVCKTTVLLALFTLSNFWFQIGSFYIVIPQWLTRRSLTLAIAPHVVHSHDYTVCRNAGFL